ncbi:VanZ family protein [bacterium]|nr:VanZ family protein [bacterium]
MRVNRPLEYNAAYRRTASQLMLILFALIAYGSLYPFGFQAPAASSWPRLSDTLWINTSPSDLLGNIGLFFPLGLAAAFAFPQRFLVIVLAFLPLAALFALVLQVAQVFIPTRVPALIDVIWNVVGTLVGIVAGRALAGCSSDFKNKNRLTALPFAIMCFWLLSQLVPFVPTLDLGLIYASLKPLPSSLALDWRSVSYLFASTIGTAYLFRELLGARRAMTWLAAGSLLLIAGKAVVMTQTLRIDLFLAVTLALIVAPVLSGLHKEQHRKLVLTVMLATYLIAALTPWSFLGNSGPFNWIPFADLLEGSMLQNLTGLLPKLHLLTLIVWIGGTRVGLALCIAALTVELIQTYMPSRSGGISEPIWIAVVVWLLHSSPIKLLLSSSSQKQPSTPESQAISSTSAKERPLPQALSVLLGVAVLISAALLIYFAVRLPGVPYNVRELLLYDSSYIACVLFSLAGLSLGAGPAFFAPRISPEKRAFLQIPLWVLVCGLTTLLLLSLSVTKESISDIAGSANLYYYVVHEDIWGSLGRYFFLALPDRAIVGWIERPVRFAALFAPLIIFLMVCSTLISNEPEARRRGLKLLAFALPTLMLAKGIAFDFSSTDNLNELIARDGKYGLGGGGYLYVLTFLIAASAAAMRRPKASGMLVTFTFFVCAGVVSWWLLSMGLESDVNKYGNTFSGVQFFLGPDRKKILSDGILFGRWIAVYTALVFGLAAGLSFSGLLPKADPGKLTESKRKNNSGPIRGRKAYKKNGPSGLKSHHVTSLRQGSYE